MAGTPLLNSFKDDNYTVLFHVPSPHRFTQSYMLLESLQFLKITEMPRIFIPHSYNVIIIHRFHVRVFPRLKLNPAVSQHIEINTKAWGQVLPSQNVDA